MSKAIVIVNPTSGKEEGEKFGPEVKKELEKMYDTVEIKWTKAAGDATQFAQAACRQKVDAIYALGGDGTVNECVNGIAPEPDRPVFSFIPLGTVNDLGRVLDIPMNPKKAIQQLTQRKKKTIDIGKVNDQYFVDIVAIGSIPDAVHEVPIEKKTRWGTLAYVMESVKVLNQDDAYPFVFDLNGEALAEESFLVLVALSNSIAGIQTMIPDAAVDDGYLHLLVVKAETLSQKVNLLPKVFAGKVTEDDNILYRRFKKGQIALAGHSNKELVTNVDGDAGDSLPVTVEVLAGHMDVFVPE
ncbi:Transcription regulator [Alkalibacterium sp. AK22]|uniref:diacylglycerol/lipid kinase family protein n=1 Tax=Alkalibacterium sp. AK22 TaxID=1229520 RepID=UPI000450E461|nr:diacylglycerol kinase family protein [Alkalibacterium sp. AK22]EXJ24107.1 Transcription regulator [Alkalibacterium sp. AK22]